MQQRYVILCCVAGVMTVFSAQAENTVTAATISGALGWLEGESHENVYLENGDKLSQLDWKIKQTPIITMAVNWDISPHITLTARGWTTLAERSAKMDDYDWLYDDQTHWSEWSYHPNSRLNHANAFDMGVQSWVVSQPNYRLGGIAGYQQTRFSWTALGGFYQYDNGATVGAFERGRNLGGYKQQFDVPYLGVVGIVRYQNVELSSLVKYSPWVKARDNDEHYLRQLTFRDEGNYGRYYSVLVDIGYYLTSCAKVFTALSWHKYAESRGGAQIIDQVSGKQRYIGGHAAGIANEYYTVTAGLTYRF